MTYRLVQIVRNSKLSLTAKLCCEFGLCNQHFILKTHYSKLKTHYSIFNIQYSIPLPPKMHVAFGRVLKQFMSGAVRRAPCAALAVLTWITKLVNSRLAETAFNSCWVSHFEVVWIYTLIRYRSKKSEHKTTRYWYASIHR